MGKEESTDYDKSSEQGTGVIKWPSRGLVGLAATLALYGLSCVLLMQRAPTLLGEKWAWLALLIVPVLTLLFSCLRTGTALAFILVYAFASATAMAALGFRLGWGELAQANYIFSHFVTVLFLASTVGLLAQLRSRQQALEQARELARRYVSEDEVTGLLTTDTFMTAVAREMRRSQRTGRPFVLLCLNLEDYFGPSLGSAALQVARRKIGHVLTSQTRAEQDLWTMWRGDLYLGLLVETDRQGAQFALKRILARLAQDPEFSGMTLTKAARCGLASYPDDAAIIEALVEFATTATVPCSQLLQKPADAGPSEIPASR